MRPKQRTLWSAVLLATLATNASAQVLCTQEAAKLTARDGDTFDSLGWSVSLSRDTALLGAFADDDNGVNSGSAYVFVRSGAIWTEQAKLTASDGSASDFFGRAVHLSGDTALVGAQRDEEGSAYVFVRSGTTWTEQAKLTASDGDPGDELGTSVALSKDAALVGASFDDDKGLLSGSAYLFVRSGTTWTEWAKLTASDAQIGGQFGRSVALSTDMALVGAVGAEAAYVFVRNGTTWTEQAKLTASDGESGDGFGVAVSLSGETALVGAFNEDENGGAGAGAAYVFTRSGTTWTQQAKLTASDGALGHEFGGSVSLQGETALLGAYHSDGNAGSAYVFTRAGTSWNERAKLTASDGESGDLFGFSVALSGGTALVGASLDDDKGSNAGSAYAYRLLPEPQTYCTAKTGLACGLPAIGFAGRPSASATSGFVIDARPAGGNLPGFLMYTNAGRASSPFQGGTLCINGAPLRRSVPIQSGGTSGQCDGVFSLDMNCFASDHCGGNPAAFLSNVGEQINCQYWGRDSMATGSFLSDALEFFVCP